MTEQIIAKNLKHLRKTKELTQDQLANNIGVNRAMIGSYEEGRATPKLSVLQSLSSYFQLTIDKLINNDLTNNQEIFDVAPTPENGKSLRVVTTVVDRDNQEMITLVPAKASAGYLNGYADADFIESLPRFTLPFPEFSKERTYRAFQIRGDSMDPIPNGAYIISEYIQNWLDLREGQSYVIVTRDEGVVFKRIYLHPSGELWLKSDNPVYEPYCVHMSRLLEIWKAVGYVCASLPDPDVMSISKLSSMVSNLKHEIDLLKERK
jgi:transcriptional regulator with XRE-family HTH domain